MSRGEDQQEGVSPQDPPTTLDKGKKGLDPNLSRIKDIPNQYGCKPKEETEEKPPIPLKQTYEKEKEKE